MHGWPVRYVYVHVQGWFVKMALLSRYIGLQSYCPDHWRLGGLGIRQYPSVCALHLKLILKQKVSCSNLHFCLWLRMSLSWSSLQLSWKTLSPSDETVIHTNQYLRRNLGGGGGGGKAPKKMKKKEKQKGVKN